MAADHVEGAYVAPDENETSPLLGHQPHSQNSSNDVASAVPEAGVDKPKVKMALLFPAVAIGVSTCQRTNDISQETTWD
jgi:hypothetical protein